MDEHILNIATRILTNEANAKEILEFNEWMSLDEKNKQKFRQLMEYWDINVGIENATPPEVSFEKFRKRISASDAKKKTWRMWTLPAAASVVLLVAGALFVYLYVKNNPAVDYYTYTNQGGSYYLVLPDSTSVYLNKDSRITYSSRYGKKDRQVELQGEAYFDVRKTGNMFRLNIANTNTVIEVLGTKFNVQAYGDEAEIVATLEEGSIMFKDGTQQVLIAPDQQLTYNKNSSVFNLREAETELFTAWKDNIYRYNRITLRELCNELGNIFGVEIAVDPKLKDIKVSGSFDYQQSLEEILNVMKKSISFQWKRKGNQITIK